MGTDIHGVWQKKTQDGWEDITENPYKEHRHYQLFAVLAGVRNGVGFAGVKTGEPVNPISPPRGLPSDFEMTNEEEHPISDVKAFPPEWEQWDVADGTSRWMGDHSFSWLTADEMLDWFESAPSVIKTGTITRRVFEEWDGVSPPKCYSGGVFGGGVVVVANHPEEFSNNPEWTHVSVEWDRSLKDELRYFFDIVAKQKAKYGEVRFVFGFDS